MEIDQRDEKSQGIKKHQVVGVVHNYLGNASVAHIEAHANGFHIWTACGSLVTSEDLKVLECHKR